MAANALLGLEIRLVSMVRPRELVGFVPASQTRLPATRRQPPTTWFSMDCPERAGFAYHTLLDSPVSRELQDLLRAEERKIINPFPAVQRRVAVLELVRSIDHFFLWQNSRGEQSTHHEQEIDSFFIYGCNKALQLFLVPGVARETQDVL
jgi:hypothetical protein